MTSPLASLIIVSGGQTGADRAALDFALAHGIAHGGWCPAGRRAEDGPLAACYQLRETPTTNYAERTEGNVRDSDATVIFALTRPLRGGTRLTAHLARRYQRPLLVLIEQQLPLWGTAESTRSLAGELLCFLTQHQVRRLNIAGPRQSQAPRIGMFVTSVLSAALAASQTQPTESRS